MTRISVCYIWKPTRQHFEHDISLYFCRILRRYHLLMNTMFCGHHLRCVTAALHLSECCLQNEGVRLAPLIPPKSVLDFCRRECHNREAQRSGREQVQRSTDCLNFNIFSVDYMSFSWFEVHETRYHLTMLCCVKLG